MPEVFYDKRDWKVNFLLPRNRCIYLYYPGVVHGCSFPGRKIDDECVMETCPIRYKRCPTCGKHIKRGMTVVKHEGLEYCGACRPSEK